jgi:putative membrane protein
MERVELVAKPTMWTDWKQLLQHKQLRLALAVLLLIPLLYTGMFISGYWNPYGHLDQLPVAFVNLDKGALSDGRTLSVGKDMENELNKKRTLDFRFVDAKEAENGLRDGRYYMSIIVPADFSRKITTLMSEHPQPAELIYKTNSGNNFVAGQIGASAVKELKDQVSRQIIKSYTTTVFKGMVKLTDGLAQAGSGAVRLTAGTEDASNGADRLHQGIGSLAGGAAKLSNGVSALHQGMSQLTDSTGKMRDGSVVLADGLGQLTEAERQLAQGSSQWSQGFTGLAASMDRQQAAQAQQSDDARKFAEQLTQYSKDHPVSAKEESLQTLIQSAERLAKETGTQQAVSGKLSQSADVLLSERNKLDTAATRITDKLASAAAASQTLAAGTARFAEGLNRWNLGFDELSGGVHSLVDGSQKLDAGSEELSQGFLRLTDGSRELSAKLSDASQQTSGLHADDPMLNMYAQPVQLVENKMNDVPNYGTGAAPYFLALGLFVGGLLAANVLPFNRLSIPSVGGWSFFRHKLGLFYSIAFIQTLIVDAVICWGFGIHVINVPRFVMFSMLVSFTFVSCILLLLTLIGPLGKFAAIFLLVTQLAASGGTFPMEMSPKIIQEIGSVMPMTYALRGFHSVISTGDWAVFTKMSTILLAFLLGCVVIMLIRILALSKSEKLARAASSAPAH